ncbi:FT-interacting protein 7-like [Curcuma longa]|uniref:FT-interacting protein 7-like n=1 Tax=Curcuma longa TaxID=136217 RepID=UPI003D9E6A7A
MSNLKLGVEVVSAHELMPKDKQGSSSPFVEFHFDGQKFRTSIKEKDLNPVWNELFYFNIADPTSLPELTLEAYVYSMNKGMNPRSFLGKVQIAGTSFVPFSVALVMHYPLEKRGMFSRVKGELGLKVFLTDDPSIKPSNPLPAIDRRPNNLLPSQFHQGLDHVSEGHKSLPKKVPKRGFHSIPNETQQQQYSAPVIKPVSYVADPMKYESQPPKVVRMFSSSFSQQPMDYALKETSPLLGGGQIVAGRVIPAQKPASTYDLVEQMQHLFVRVVKARDLPMMDITGSLDPYVELRVGNYKGKTRHFDKNQNPEWNEVFAFPRERVQSSVIEVMVKDKDLIKDDFVGIVRFDLNDVPTRVPPDSSLAPEWYRLEDKNGDKTKGELMVAIWIGTQADESFADAWHLDAAAAIDATVVSSLTKSKVYHAPRLWYVRVNVIEAQDIFIANKTRIPDVYAKVQLGNQILKTRPVQIRTFNPLWNEDLMFVTAEPFEDQLIISVQDRVAPNKDEVIGHVAIPLGSIEKRLDDHNMINARWFSLENPVVIDVDQLKKNKFSGKIHLRVCLEGGYHVLDESTHYSSDLRPTAKQLWKPSIGLLELGILNAEGLHPMKTREGKGTCDTYCVAKYGRKWVRTRTIIDNLSPKFNEQYTWEVYDPATVLTVGVFDNWQLEKGANGNRDSKIGKVRIRLSTLEAGRVYTHSYPLLVLHSSGVKKMGELHLAVRFSSTSLINMMSMYSRPLLPKMHYIQPLNMMQQDMLRHQAVQIIAARLSRMEPPLRKEVVEYMSDVDSHMWSMRRSKANFFRLMSVFSGLFAASKWFGSVCMWKKPIITVVLVHILFTLLVCFPELILPTVFLYMFLIGLWNYRLRPRYPPHMNIKLSHAEAVHPDELDEEFDTFPTSRSSEIVRMRYDRLRSVAGRIQTVVGDLATQGERLQALLSWRDPRATAIFLLFSMMAAIVLYTTPLQVLVALVGFYIMRHPRFRNPMPSAPLNFFRRLPAKTDSLL